MSYHYNLNKHIITINYHIAITHITYDIIQHAQLYHNRAQHYDNNMSYYDITINIVILLILLYYTIIQYNI